MQSEALNKHLDRVRAHTSPPINARIDRLADANIEHVARQGRDAMVWRLAELEREWDIDRAMMANFALLGGTAFALGLRKRPRGRRMSPWHGFFTAQLAFLLLHATVGWCPPASLFRRLGFRTQKEIDDERAELVRRLSPGPGAAPAGGASSREPSGSAPVRVSG